MESTIAVKDEREAYLIQTGLQDPDLRIFLEVCALLKQIVEDDKEPVPNAKRKLVLHAVCCLYGCDK
jgi:hypothetical protein